MSDAGEACASNRVDVRSPSASPATRLAELLLVTATAKPPREKKKISSDDDRAHDALVDAHGRKGGIGAHVDGARAGQ